MQYLYLAKRIKIINYEDILERRKRRIPRREDFCELHESPCSRSRSFLACNIRKKEEFSRAWRKSLLFEAKQIFLFRFFAYSVPLLSILIFDNDCQVSNQSRVPENWGLFPFRKSRFLSIAQNCKHEVANYSSQRLRLRFWRVFPTHPAVSVYSRVENSFWTNSWTNLKPHFLLENTFFYSGSMPVASSSFVLGNNRIVRISNDENERFGCVHDSLIWRKMRLDDHRLSLQWVCTFALEPSAC